MAKKASAADAQVLMQLYDLRREAEMYPFLGELREKLGDPEAFHDVEEVITRSQWGRQRLKFMMKRVEEWREKMTAKA